MKKTLRRVLLVTAMLILALSVHAAAAPKLYSAKTITIPNQYGGGWSNQFTLPARSTVTIGINITGNNQSYYINNGMTYVLENVNTRQKVYLSVPTASKYNLNYSLSAIMNAGTYSFGVYYSGNQAFKLHFTIYVNGGLNIPDTLEVMKGTTETVTVKPSDGSTNYIKIKSVKSSAPGYATVSFDNSKTPPTVSVKGMAIGDATITVTGEDGSYDTMYVKVTKYVPAPTLNYKSLTLSAGNKIYNAVENATSTVTWSSSNTNVAKVNQSGRIRAVGYGKCVIRAKTVSNGKTYDLACTVKVNRTSPNYKATLVRYYPNKKLFKVTVENLSSVPMYFYSKNGSVRDVETNQKLGKTQLQSGAMIKVGSKKTKTFMVKTKKKLDKTRLGLYELSLFFKQDKRNYYAYIYQDVEEGLYSWKRQMDKYYATYSK